MRLTILYEQTLTYEQFIKQPSWIDTLYHNYLTGQPPLTAPDPASNTINNDTDHFTEVQDPIVYLKQLPKPTRDHLTKALILKTKNPYYIYRYAIDIIKDRWPEGEKIISQDQHYAYQYVLYILNGKRWPEAEKTISQDPEYAYRYARDVIKGRWPEAEGVISQDEHYAYAYAHDVINMGQQATIRWPKGEEAIKQHPGYAYYYACDVIKGRWPEAENTIRQDQLWWDMYVSFIKNTG